MQQRLSLGEFLRSRRARLQPDDAGLPSYGGRRRVPGLRREELAQLAGVSVAYYTRLEQGLSQNASDAVLEAIARVLRLDDDEKAHLHSLARPRAPTRHRARPERVRPSLRTVVNSFGGPAAVIGRRLDVLVWNRLAHALLAAHLDVTAPDRAAERPNMARLAFLDCHTRELYADWPAKADAVAAHLRLAAGRYPEDRQLAELIGELSMKSPDFAALWTEHPVRECVHTVREYHHPVVGRMTLAEEVMVLPEDPGQRLVMFGAEPGSPSEAALQLLDEVTHEEETMCNREHAR